MSDFAYLGTSEFAVDVLAGLSDRGLEPSLVITPPDRPRGRGRLRGEAPVAAAANQAGLPVLKVSDVNDGQATRELANRAIDIAMVCAFGQIIREPLLSDLTMLNVHPSLLPRWRGAAPIERAIMSGDEETGVCIIEVEAGLDSGPVLASRREPIRPDDNYGSLAPRLAKIGGELAAEVIKQAAQGRLAPVAQADEGVTYAEKIDRSERRLDPARPAIELDRQIRALTPHIGTFLELDEGGGRLAVHSAALPAAEGLPPELVKRVEDAAASDLIVAETELLLVCGEGLLRLERVQVPGGRAMAAADYLRGHRPASRALTGAG